MATEYTMFGYDGLGTPVVATNVAAEQAKAFAQAKGLEDFFCRLRTRKPPAPAS